MRVAVVAGPDPGHAFPAIALCLRFLDAGDRPTLLTGVEWLDTARRAGVDAAELLGLDPDDSDDDADDGAKLHRRAARMAALNVSQIRELAPDLVVSDVITACGGMAAELLGLPWVELCPHPLYLPSKGLPPIGSGLAPGVGVRGRLRDTMLRFFTARSIRVSSPLCSSGSLRSRWRSDSRATRAISAGWAAGRPSSAASATRST